MKLWLSKPVVSNFEQGYILLDVDAVCEQVFIFF